LEADDQKSVLGWHDSHSASVALIGSDGRIRYAAAEERFTKQKLFKGYPRYALDDLANQTAIREFETCYVDLPLATKVRRNAGMVWNTRRNGLNSCKTLRSLLSTGLGRFRGGAFHGIVGSSNGHDMPHADRRPSVGFDALCDHHTAHAASAYYPSGFDDAVVVTIDGVGDCLSGSVFDGKNGRLRRRRTFYYNELTVGADYEVFTAMLGFDPDRHCGKITGLAAYGTPDDACLAGLREFFVDSWKRGNLNYFDRMHSRRATETLAELRDTRRRCFGRFTRQDLAHAMQHMAEQAVLNVIRDNVTDIASRNIALAGGVFANVRINQKIKELGFANLFVQPAMDDGGLSLGAALHHLGRTRSLKPYRLNHMFVGPTYSDDRIEDALDRAGVSFDRVGNIGPVVAKLLADGQVVARFDGAMEFGPRALGNRSILCDTRDPSVNQWLNHRLKRTEFMPFAPATLADHGDECYHRLDGCRHAAEFMTVTFDCTDHMKRVSPAVVHIDGTARPQLVSQGANPGLYDIINEYHKITGIASVVNTSFNMHESPIVATPEDAITAFQQSRLDYLAIGPFLAKQTLKANTPALNHAIETSQPAAV